MIEARAFLVIALRSRRCSHRTAPAYGSACSRVAPPRLPCSLQAEEEGAAGDGDQEMEEGDDGGGSDDDADADDDADDADPDAEAAAEGEEAEGNEGAAGSEGGEYAEEAGGEEVRVRTVWCRRAVPPIGGVCI